MKCITGVRAGGRWGLHGTGFPARGVATGARASGEAAPSPWGWPAAGRARAGPQPAGLFRQARFSMTDASALISTSYSRYLARAAAAR
ncbi:hypothetical protein A8E97_10380, partial [Burkholderia cenocepacia]|uniref:hypothetical protein n=1 Tax=Burkholderia cenocepacia TaxID=95486 RepID=UPI0009C9E18E